MTIDDVRDIAQDGESAQVEFKRSTGQRTAAAKAVCGMLNGQGGYVLFGVKDDGRSWGRRWPTRPGRTWLGSWARLSPRWSSIPTWCRWRGSALSSWSACRGTVEDRMSTTDVPTFGRAPRRARWSNRPTRSGSLKTAIPGGAGRPAQPRV
ncbi:MAG: hypothetical protein BRD55_06495 [Bacteroidetes bacterium SW_9_63_38]|nr:MAG: hypothetical protein BRD55_06495 [Bacteroidetes bacterium SW_9_63_38]